MTRLYMIRHGKPASSWGDDVEADPGLDETGRAQAAAVAERLLALPADQRPLKVVSSPLRRCRETALPLASALGVSVEIDPRVGEIPTPSQMPAAERPEWLRKAFQGRWSQMVGDLDYEVWRREVTAAVASHPRTAVFSHYVAINAAVSTVRGDDLVMGFRPDHTSVTTFEELEGRLTLIDLGREASTQVL
jgi:broad specificity phosphatase PhoE